MKKVEVHEAINKPLATDVTMIEDFKKSVLFKRGHIISESDIPKLLSIGRHYVWIEDEDSSLVHEDDAGIFLMESIKGDNLGFTLPQESKVKLIAETDGVLVVNTQGLFKINEIEDVVVATKPPFTFVKSRTPVAIGKIMPKEISKEILLEVENIANMYKPIVDLKPITPHKIALFPVGNEFIEGLREEVLSFKIKEYLESLGQEIVLREILPDNDEKIKGAGLKAFEKGVDIVIYMGGMAVDPDDRTVPGIKLMGVEVVKYGVPIFPGFTFLLGYLKDKVVLGIPSSSGITKEGTSFHFIMPIILSNYRITKNDLIKFSLGGYLT
ncbi:molybdopterin-binding protein [Caldisericum sp.]|uniref:molybdopterin-binding protein n=1 Tax=Caldisericum sp. TaxID=2499687 RepID=UPI003D122E26